MHRCLLLSFLVLVGCERGEEKGVVEACPDPASGESESDCPWAGIARSLSLRAANGKPLGPSLETEAPELAADLDDDAQHPEVLDLWGRIENFEETSNAVIVAPEVLDFLGERLKAPKRENVVVHAGVQQTYGHLFSLVKTTAGFERARWTKPDIEKGLALPDGSLSPLPVGGSLLRNVTFFAGRIALADDAQAKATLVGMQESVTPALVGFAFRDLKVKRVLETIPLEEGRSVDLRTDLVGFAVPQGQSTHVVIYSAHDSKDGRSRILAVFPAPRATAEALLGSSIGDRADLTARYGAFVDGVTDATRAGKRALVDVTPY